MESYFLAETLKYLYLLFDSDNFLSHNPSSPLNMTDFLSVDGGDHLLYNQRLLRDGCNVGKSGYIMSTEAHPIDVGTLHCCKWKWKNKKMTNDGITSRQGCTVRPFHARLELYAAEFN